MADITFEEILHAAQKLNPLQKAALIHTLQEDHANDITREGAVAELEALRDVGAFKNVESLYGKYANPNVPEMSEEAFHTDLHIIATEL